MHPPTSPISFLNVTTSLSCCIDSNQSDLFEFQAGWMWHFFGCCTVTSRAWPVTKKTDSFDLCESPTEHEETRRSEILLLKRSLIKSEYNKVPFVCFIRCQIEMCSTARRKHVGLRLFIMFTLPYLQHALRWQLNTRVTRQKLITFSSGSNAIFPHCNSCESLQACERARERQAKGQLIPQLHLQGDLPITGCELVWPWKVSFRHQRAKWCVGL